MAGQGRTARRRAAGRGRTARRGAVVALLGCLLIASGCSAPPVADAATRDIQQTLDHRADALLDRDESGYLAAVDPAAGELLAAERRTYQNLVDVPVRSWEYRLRDVERSGTRASARAELRYRLEGYDTAPVTSSRTLELTERDGRWYVTADRPGDRGVQQLWQQGAVEVVHGRRSLVLGVGQDNARLREIAAAADEAVPAVDEAWPGEWSGRVVVLVPASVSSMAGLLGASAGSYRGIAAVTTGETGPKGSSPADRVIVNPDAYGVLGDFGRRIVLTHETTHVATRAATSDATPMWLSEGFSDWVAYRGSGRTDGQAAPELERSLHRGALPAALPEDEDFAFDAEADELARAYEGGRLACDLIAERWGEAELTDFYQAVGEREHREGAVESAMNDVLSVTPDEFGALWRDYVRERLR
ncbi:hypothetical protein OIE71_08460 [Streptomyces sp. NBC_01725]|uniref:hypothetical protein n=1 Tax=Streptomyces sp. NBC_01725 TaxID=2975923 RepID=UPI002E2989D4|nr:hypothetical protein [Streptomyces sp. NBC_01725]